MQHGGQSEKRVAMRSGIRIVLDYEEEEPLATVLHFLSRILVEYTAADIPFYGKRAEIITKV